MTGPRCGVTKWTKSGSGALVGETAGVHGEKLADASVDEIGKHCFVAYVDKSFR